MNCSTRWSLTLDSPQGTHAAGVALGKRLPPKAVVLLYGPMGAGKTTLVKGVCQGLAIPPQVVISPTYTLVNIYHGVAEVFHVDFYRIRDPEELLEMDPRDWLNPQGPTLIEWPEKAAPLLVGLETLQISLIQVDGQDDRRLMFVDAPPGWEPVLDGLIMLGAVQTSGSSNPPREHP
ncbi:MAG: tRNA (adenosine(37)-N6)-threonylcarbamoyltransferase complex ATPase subunit type 1 TsaE [Deltaproteobacteria bacterium]|nr:tRNA (adenosine(37)-N6)-threonylcarbamoyltransferase complex ATPase subunit type 1 TsaE [Deltaproteobacteria bacterium]